VAASSGFASLCFVSSLSQKSFRRLAVADVTRKIESDIGSAQSWGVHAAGRAFYSKWRQARA
jgi:hypothetical protein